MRTLPSPGTLFGAAALVVSVAFSSLPAAVAGTAAGAARAVGIVDRARHADDADTVRGRRPIDPGSKLIGTRRARGRLLVLDGNGRIPKRALPKGTPAGGAVPDIVVRSYEAQGSSSYRATATAWCLNGERLIGAAGYGRDPYNAQPMPLAPFFTLTGNPATTGTVNPDGFSVVSEAPPGQSVVAQALCASVRP
jgi:hypothetical protein